MNSVGGQSDLFNEIVHEKLETSITATNFLRAALNGFIKSVNRSSKDVQGLAGFASLFFIGTRSRFLTTLHRIERCTDYVLLYSTLVGLSYGVEPQNHYVWLYLDEEGDFKSALDLCR